MNKLYSDSQGHQFQIVEEKIINGEHWIYYQRTDNQNLCYNCLAEAFYNRFFQDAS